MEYTSIHSSPPLLFTTEFSIISRSRKACICVRVEIVLLEIYLFCLACLSIALSYYL